jgi:hypothetical protein
LFFSLLGKEIPSKFKNSLLFRNLEDRELLQQSILTVSVDSSKTAAATLTRRSHGISNPPEDQHHGRNPSLSIAAPVSIMERDSVLKVVLMMERGFATAMAITFLLPTRSTITVAPMLHLGSCRKDRPSRFPAFRSRTMDVTTAHTMEFRITVASHGVRLLTTSFRRW